MINTLLFTICGGFLWGLESIYNFFLLLKYFLYFSNIERCEVDFVILQFISGDWFVVLVFKFNHFKY